MDEYFCPKCGAILNDQYGFDPNKGTWRCTECGMHLMDDDIYNGDSFEGVAWYCDKCGALLNRQSGFSDSYGLWICTECGHPNGTTEADVISEEPEFSCPNCGVALDFQPGFNRYDDDWDCTKCGVHLHHDYSEDEYKEVDSDSFSDNDDESDDDSDNYSSVYSYSSSSSASYNSFGDQSSGYSSRQNYSSSYASSAIPHSSKTKKKANWKLRIIGILFLVVVITAGYYEIRLLIPVGHSSVDLIGRDYECVVETLKESGFSRVRTSEITDLPLSKISGENKTDAIKIGFADEFSATPKYPSNFPVVITYHTLEKYAVPMSSKEAKGADYQDVMRRFKDAGFNNIALEVEYDIITGWMTDDGEVKSVVINGDNKFSTGKEYRADAEIVITYHTYRNNKPK